MEGQGMSIRVERIKIRTRNEKREALSGREIKESEKIEKKSKKASQ